MQDFVHSLPMMLYRALDALMPKFRRIFSEFGLTEQQWRILRVLWEHNSTSARELAELTLIPAPSLVGVVDRLSANGLVSRKRSKTDRRSVLLQVTAKGRALESKVSPKVERAYQELQQSMDPLLWQQLMKGLAHVSKPTEREKLHARAK